MARTTESAICDLRVAIASADCQSAVSLTGSRQTETGRPIDNRRYGRLTIGATWRWVWVSALSSLLTLPLVAAELTPAQLQFFENHIRPVLAENCYKCHSQ